MITIVAFRIRIFGVRIVHCCKFSNVYSERLQGTSVPKATVYSVRIWDTFPISCVSNHLGLHSLERFACWLEQEEQKETKTYVSPCIIRFFVYNSVIHILRVKWVNFRQLFRKVSLFRKVTTFCTTLFCLYNRCSPLVSEIFTKTITIITMDVYNSYVYVTAYAWALDHQLFIIINASKRPVMNVQKLDSSSWLE